MARSRQLVTITGKLGKFYDKWKDYTGRKDQERDDFFAAATKALEKTTLATKTLALDSPFAEEAEARGYLAKYHPRWKITSLFQDADGYYMATLEEDPAFKNFVYVNQRDKRVYTRQVVDGPAVLDDERLQDDDPELYKQVTATTPWGDTIIWPLDKLSPETLGRLEGYIYNDTPRIKLPAPRKAKPEELNEDDD